MEIIYNISYAIIYVPRIIDDGVVIYLFGFPPDNLN